jgi:hypothetical protein
MKKWQAAAISALVLLGASPSAFAQRARPRFEPTDLDLQEKGTASIDLQLGPMKGDDDVRLFAPDVEMTLSVSSNAELEVDGTFGLNHLESAEFLDNTLVAMRVGLLDLRDAPKSPNAWAAGVQVGPRLPTLPGSRGIGVEALSIVGRTAGRMHVFLQGGLLVDCAQLVAPGVRGARPRAFELGLDVDVDLDERDAWSAKAQLGGALFRAPDDSQLHLVIGPSYKVVPSIELSAVALLGFLKGSDRLGALLGVATRFRAF